MVVGWNNNVAKSKTKSFKINSHVYLKHYLNITKDSVIIEMAGYSVTV